MHSSKCGYAAHREDKAKEMEGGQKRSYKIGKKPLHFLPPSEDSNKESRNFTRWCGTSCLWSCPL